MGFGACGEYPDSGNRYHPYHRQSSFTPAELVDQFLIRIPTFHIGERLFMWVGTHYRAVAENEARGRIMTVLRDELKIPNVGAVLSQMLTLLRCDERIAAKQSDEPVAFVALRNGVLNLNTLQLDSANPDRFLTHYLDADWLFCQPNCPVFDRFLNQTAGGDPVLKQRILEAIGYLLVSDYRAKRFVVFQGVGDCGKSVLGNLIASFFEQGDVSSLSDRQFGDRFSMASIANARLCLCMDLPGGTIDAKAVSLLKQVTGGDMVPIEAKGKDAYTAFIRCKLLFGTNFPIQLKHRDDAFAKRVLLIPFRYSVPPEVQDRNLLDKLKQEKNGILYLALTAYAGVIQRGFQFSGEDCYGFKPQDIVIEQDASNLIGAFVQQCCILDGVETFCPTETLFQAFKNFCTSAGVPPMKTSSIFSRALKTYLSQKVRPDKQRVNGNSVNGFWGIALR